MTENWRRCAALIAALTASFALSVPAQAASIASEPPGALVPLPSLPVNACHNSSLPQDYGTNFPVPNDPNGFGFANQTVIGWEGNYYAPFAYLSGSYFARGVPDTYPQGGQSYCGAMYSFGVYDYGLAAGQAPAPGSVQWTMADGYLPALTTSFVRDNVKVSITDFADKQTIAGNPVELVYTRVSVINQGTASVSVPSGQSGPGLVELDSNADTVAPGATVHHDFAAAVDTFGADENGSDGLVVSGSYEAGFGTAGSASAEQWMHIQRPLPLPPGATDLALTATPSASYTSPWTSVTAINNGIYPVQSNDDNDLTPYWGTWPDAGSQYMELDWSQPVTTNGSSVYFADDGGGLQLPASWTVQYWNGSAFVNVSDPSSYPEADNTFNQVTFDPVTTTKLRVVMQAAPTAGGVGAIEWVVPSIPG